MNESSAYSKGDAINFTSKQPKRAFINARFKFKRLQIILNFVITKC